MTCGAKHPTEPETVCGRHHVTDSGVDHGDWTVEERNAVKGHSIRIKPCPPVVARAYDDLMMHTGGVAEARDLLRWALTASRPPFDVAEAAESVARQADALAIAARAYARALTEAGK